MKTPAKTALAVIGTVAIDSVETPLGKRDRVFGGSASYFSYAASFFTPVSLVAVVGKDFPEEYRAILKERPIDLSHLETLEGKTFHWTGKYEFDLNSAKTLDTQLNVLLDFDPKVNFTERPECLFLANIDPVLQARVLDQLEKPRLKFVACDTMNFWITHKHEELLKVLPRIDCLVVNDGEARQLTGETNLVKAARKINGMGPGIVIIKKGEHGVLVFHEDHFFALPAYPLEVVVDPTGAGDSFAGGFMGYLAAAEGINAKTVKRAVAFGTVVASFTVEDFGLESLRRLTREKIQERLELFGRISSFTTV
ncbi:MAG: PfkB family carbohydrate kinase [Candidatus Omnitrophica bacterium]|nr:PfkB family carbohydrate kinase [Candidatus Omnitrophota bacterium]MDD5670633.1 PfkB family carbohydrate kinase [Candidatus Omnitrophota bacterium]